MGDQFSRRDVLEQAAKVAAIAALGTASCKNSGTEQPPTAGVAAPAIQTMDPASINVPGANSSPRTLGKTGALVETFSLGGEGILRTNGREKEAVAVIVEALRLGIRYCDTAPAYDQSQDYYGAAFRELGKESRNKIFLASKTHVRTRDGALKLLDDSLRRLNTDRLDLWQLHDLRTKEDLDQIFGKGGAIEAVEQAKTEGRVRFVGITGHQDPAILLEAMRRYAVDTVLCPVNPADARKLPFITTVIPEARKRQMGVIGMKIMGRGQIIADGAASAAELLRYAATFADTSIVGCSSPAEVRQNLAAARDGALILKDEERVALEKRVWPNAERYDFYKA